MIAKDTTVAVNFMVLSADGFPATGKASNITATISINGAQATSINDTIIEKSSGWYYFTHTFGTVGNVFIEFSATDCTIEPWEDEVINMASGSAPSAADIATAVWGYSSGRTITNAIPSAIDIASEVWYIAAFNISGTDVPYGDVVKATYTTMDGVSGMVADVKLKTDRLPYDPAAVGSAMTLTSAYDAAKTASQFNANTDTVTINSTQAATMTTATGFATPANITAAQTAIINAIPSTTGLATSSDISTAQIAIINAMPSTTGLATGSDVSTAQAAIIAAMPDISGLSTFDPSNDAVSVSSASITSIQSGLAKTSDLSGLSTFDATNDTVTVNSTQAATFVTATGFATPTNVTDAVSALETYGDAHWTGGGSGGGGITAEDVWKYSGTYGRTLTASPTDITSLATKTDITTAQTAIVNAMPSTTGLATSNDVSTAQTAIINALPSTTGLATATDVTNAQAAIIAEIPDISGLSTFDPANETVTIDSDQAATMVTATGFATPSDIPTNDITAIKEKVDTLENTDLTAVQNLLTQLDAGVLHWSTSPTRLVLYKEDNSVLRVYSLERDADGNITRISPLNA